MSYFNQTRNDERKEEKPPHSRIFVVCGKHISEEELRPHFEKFGEVEDLFIPKDRNSGNSKGVAYIKYAKTSSAATAIQELHLKTVDGDNYSKPFKVMVASNKNDSNVANEDKYKRLFIKVPKQATESDIRRHFSEFGRIDSVRLQRDKLTEESKGFAYVQYRSFLDAAKAFEECDRQYKPVFATPKDELKRSRSSLDTHGDAAHANDSFSSNYSPHMQNYRHHSMGYPPVPPTINSLIKTQGDGYTRVSVVCSPPVAQKHIEKLLNIIPGMQQFQYTVDAYNGLCKALVTYNDESAAAYAVERINNYEFPSGELITVKPEKNQLNRVANDLSDVMNNFKRSLSNGSPDLMQLADAIAQASALIKEATSSQSYNHNDRSNMDVDDSFCSVPLPSPQPVLDFNTRVAKRCFIVCKPQPPSLSALRDVFSRFGDLIDVSTFPNKTFGFAKYGSVRAADAAIANLNGATVCGMKLKVLEADERPAKDDKMEDDDVDVGRKRIKMDKTVD